VLVSDGEKEQQQEQPNPVLVSNKSHEEQEQQSWINPVLVSGGTGSGTGQVKYTPSWLPVRGTTITQNPLDIIPGLSHLNQNPSKSKSKSQGQGQSGGNPWAAFLSAAAQAAPAAALLGVYAATSKNRRSSRNSRYSRSSGLGPPKTSRKISRKITQRSKSKTS
jgi:hypothetical protein